MKFVKGESKLFKWCGIAILIIIVYKILDSFTSIGELLNNFLKIIKPFIMAILLAYLLYIPCKKIENKFLKTKTFRKKARGLAVATTYILALLVIILIINIIIPILSESVIDLAQHLPGYYENALEYINNLPEDSIINKNIVYNVIGKLQEIDIMEYLNLDNITTYVDKVVGFASGIFNAFVTIIVSIYILLERSSIVKFVRRLNSALFDKKGCEAFNKYFDKGNEIFFKYISSQVLDAFIVAIIMTIALLIMRVKYAVLLGFLIGLFNLIPYFGAIVAVILATLITIFTGGFAQAIWVVIVLVVLQQIDANILNPKIIGDALEMSRILIIFSVTVGGAYFGVIGMFLGAPVIGVVRMMLNDYIDRNQKQEGIT